MQLRWRLLLARERTLDLKGQRREQRVDLDALDVLADALDDDGRRAYVAVRWSVIAMRTADWKLCETAARRTMALAERAGDHALRLSGQRLLASALTSSGNPEAARALAQQGLAEARERGLRANEAAFLNTMSVVASHQQDLMGLLDLARQSLAIDRETGNRRSEAITLGTLGASWMGLGDHVQAKRDLEEALRLIRTNGDRSPESTTLINLSQLALWQGEDVRALALANSALETALLAEARDWEAVALLYIGHAEQALGRHAAAAQAYERAQMRAREVGHSMEHIATAGLARVALAQGDTAEALRQVNGVLAYLDDGGKLETTQSPTFIELTCYQVLARSSDLRAAEWLERAHTHLMARAATIPDAALREGFLKNIPEHREIIAAWAATQLTQENAGDPDRACGKRLV
jgi:tetratricopeptide (TPR) repeat protein